jgi:hypothetical protein
MKNSTHSLIFAIAVGISFIPAFAVAVRDMARSVQEHEQNYAMSKSVATNRAPLTAHILARLFRSKTDVKPFKSLTNWMP